MRQDTMLLCPNAVVNIKNEMARKRKVFNLGTVKRLVLPLNVGKRNGKTFIGGINNSGNHWVLVVVELRPFKRILYCDTLAWNPPSNIVDVVNSFVNHMPRVGMYDDTHFFLAHSPMATSRLGHVCDWRCRNYPLQTCSDICGVIVLINTALATLDRSLFQYLIGPYEKEAIYIQRPSQNAHYLRRIVMSWFAESRIELDYVLLQPDWRDNIPTVKSDHSFCLRRDTASNSKKKLKLSLNHKASSSSGLTPEATQNHSSSEECTSPTPTSDSVTNASTCVPDTNQSNGSSPLSSEPTLSPSPKTFSSAVDPHSSLFKAPSSCKKRFLAGTPPSSRKPKKVARSSAVHTSTVKKPQPLTRPDPPRAPSPTHNNNPQATTTRKNGSSDQPPHSTRLPTSPTSRPAESATESPPADSVPLPKGPRRFQCEYCGMQLSSRNCLYKHKLGKHQPSQKVDKAPGSKHIVCSECKEKETR